MLRSDHSPQTNFKLKFSNVIGRLHFKPRAERANQKSIPSASTSSAQWSQTFWGRKFMKTTTLVVALLCSASIVLADIKITTKSTASGQSFTSMTYIKGARQRTEGMGYTTIYQCDLKRTILINDKTRTYTITPFGEKDAAKSTNSHNSGGASARRGGVVTYTTTTTDMGERKTILGLSARHLKSKTVVTTSEGACNSMNMEMESDGWYADIADGLSCQTEQSAASAFNQSDCVDEIRYKSEGTAKPGYPVMVTTKMKFNAGADGAGADIPASSSMQEVVDVSSARLDAALFDIPAGYKEVKSAQELGSPY
jgi:hypothetical protein